MPSPPTERQDWTTPGAFEVAPGVYRIPLPMPNDGLAAVNVYAIEDGKGITLIDGGWSVAPARRDLELALKQLGATPRSLTRILVTHAHRDHYTLAVQLRREFGVPIALGIGERPTLEAVMSGMASFTPQLALLREAGADALAAEIVAYDRPMSVDEGWELPDHWLEEGIVDVGTRRLQILATPGHTRGHVVFVDPENALLFAGDHVLPRITPSIGLEGVPAASPLRDFLASLAKVRALPDLLLFGAHGPAAPSTHARVDELVAHHDARLAEMSALVTGSARPVTAFEVASQVGWTRHRKALSDLDVFNGMLAVIETVAHLRLLASTGAVASARDPSGVVLFAKLPAPPPA